MASASYWHVALADTHLCASLLVHSALSVKY